MALSLRNPLLVKQAVRAQSRKAKVQLFLKELFSYLAQHRGNPDLQLVAINGASSTSIVIADAPCKLMALYLKKPAGSATPAFIKASDDTTTASATAPALSIELPSNQEEILIFPDGLPFGTGLALRSDTTAAGSTGSVTADQSSGWAIIAAP